ncbi:MAG: flagellar filament capping protein FliD [Armatimonadetes bacterium]|nr:flagellar filament capping protein FliD [Armatimonadota bacterium]
MSISGVTFSGLSSGIDSDSIIQRLLTIEAQPIGRLQNQQQQIRSRQTLLQQLKGLMGTMSGAAMSLNSAQAFSPVSAKSSDEEVATLSAGTNATAGTYNLTVSKLATSHKISTTAQTDVSSALSLSGLLVINGKGVTVEASDSLTALAQKINSAQANVVASVINGGTGAAYLTLTSGDPGADNKVQISDASGTVASTLGLASGSASIREAITNGATSAGFESSTTAIGELWGTTGLSSAGFTINGVSVSVNLQTQSLADLVNTINAAGTGATASVRSEETDGVTSYYLDITGASTPTFVDTDGALAALGILQKGYGNQLIAAQDAEFTLDGVSLTSSTNSVTEVIPDVTLNLLKANVTTPEASVLTLTQDNTAVKDKVKEYVNAYNGIIDFIKSNTSFDKETYAAGQLFGDSLVQQVEDTLSNLIFSDVDGLTTAYDNVAQLGFSFGDGGKLKLDEAALDKALATNPSAVAAVFIAKGQTTVSSLQYVSSTSKSVASGVGQYDISISQVATKGSYTAEAAQTSVTATSENLTFSGSLFGSTNYVMTVPSGSSQTAIVNLINADEKLKDLLLASIESGSLKLTSKKYGANGNFAVVSNVAAAANSSGIGTSSAGAAVTGVDVAGTINGETATGNGQYLTGDSGNDTTDGLQILYTGTATGNVGSLTFTKGTAALIEETVSTFTDSITGFFTTNDKSLQDQIDTIDQTISDLEERLTLKQQQLKQKFAAMEAAMSQLQQQMNSLSAINR